MIRKGTKDDVAVIIKMVEETVEIMKEEKNDQWDETYPTVINFEQDIEKGSLYVIEENGTILGSITTDQNEPDEYKTVSWRKPEAEAFTFHRLVVAPHVRGKGIAGKLISFAEQNAVKRGVTYMKIDTYSLNIKAQQTFVKNGYKKAGEMAFHGKENPFYCYDKFL